MLSNTISLPSAHSSGPITAVVSPDVASFLSALADAVVEPRQKARGPAHAKPAQSAAGQQKERNDGECQEEQDGVGALGRQARNQERHQQDSGENERRG